jgi:hypothetical protein
MSAIDYRRLLDSLVAERRTVVCSGDGGDDLTALDEDVAAYRDFYVGAAVTEIATLRAQIGGADQG